MPTTDHADQTPARATTQTFTNPMPETAQPANVVFSGELTKPQHLPPATVMYLQRSVGNRAVTRLVRGGPVVQAKLMVGPVGDRYEQEADRVARRVVEGPPPVQRHHDEEEHGAVAGATGGALQRSVTAFDKQLPIQRHHGIRKPSEPVEEEEDELEGEDVQRSPLPGAISGAPAVVQRHHGIRKPSEPVEEEEDELEGEDVQRSATRSDGSFTANGDFTKQLRASMGRGRPLPGDVRRHMEPRIGANFDHVRVHTGPDAVQMSRDIHAEAFTHGSHIYFGADKFRPASKQGQHLLAHELTHVVQQTGGSVQRMPTPSIQRKWRSPKQWWKDKQTAKAEKRAALDTVDYDNLQGLKRGQVLPEVGKMAERRMKDMMKYDQIVINEESTRRQVSDALALIDDDEFMQGVINAVNEAHVDEKDVPKASTTHVAPVRAAVKTGLAGHETETKDLTDYFMTMVKAIVKDADYKPKTRMLNEFIKQSKEYSKQRAQTSPKGLRPESKYEGLPGMSQTETFVEERKNVQFKQVTVPPEDIPRWATALKQMDAVKALLEPDTAPPVNQEVGWRGGGNLGDKIDWVKDVRKAKIIGPLATHLDNKRAKNTKIFGVLAQVDTLMRRVVEPEMLGRVPVPTFHISTRGAQTFTNPWGLRASAARGEVNVAYNEDMPTIAHEVGHIIEEYLPMDDWADIHMLLSERHKAAGGGTRASKGESIFTRNEGRYKGKYVTSKYTSRGYTKDNAEVLSMWMQFMAKPGDAIKLIDGDPQHAALILRMMRPADYAKTTALRPFDDYLPNPTGDEGPLARYKKAQQKTMALYKM